MLRFFFTLLHVATAIDYRIIIVIIIVIINF
jgi:hypothetical protein